ncbi:glycosyltransferase family 1 protein [Microbacterium sp. cx-55]|uniref:rhamnosyltransferase WsaF family glycosyltransferase n=1 Tax=Microbacterium sp. cx-55 TaxID=2875948 RepID=UPI001CBF8349|nr:glycosyltransferase family 1 protein [Microbacterium sp. cx-55]MBZ4486904.1 glycosyltransferase family 1 protein [Microbacterium sp. cx-55]UGB35827.1 glycosyltransferase family 1 protein [Microbacterium sp. cx-55]
MGSGGRRLLARVRGRSPRYLAQYAALRLTARLRAHELEFPLLSQDLADSASLRPPVERERNVDRAPEVAWLAAPPGPGSGGHTTQFRMMAAAIEAGQKTTLLLYDRHGGEFARKADVVRRAWPWMTADIRPAPDRITGYDAVVATSWPTAHVAASRVDEGRLLYFVQDYEPYFVPHGAEYALAQDSYRFGFRHIALGHMVQDALRDEVDAASDFVPFGCDTDIYRALPAAGPRRGVVFYAKRSNDRRGFALAIRTLSAFHEACPDEPIHIYGDAVDDAPFPHVAHGNLDPTALNALYNTVVAGLALSFTNISLVAEELLAAGAIAVVNDSPLPRADLGNPHAAWARATPSALAEELITAVRRPDRDAHAARVAASVVGRSWRETQQATAALIADELTRVGHPRA